MYGMRQLSNLVPVVVNGFKIVPTTSTVPRKTTIRTIAIIATTDRNRNGTTSSRLADSGEPSNEDLLKMIDDLKIELKAQRDNLGDRIVKLESTNVEQDKRIKAQGTNIVELQSTNVELTTEIKTQGNHLGEQIVELKSEITGVRVAFSPATVNGLMETAVAYAVDGVKADCTRMSDEAYQASKFVALVLTIFVNRLSAKQVNFRKLSVETRIKAVTGAIVFVKTLSPTYVKDHWPPDRNLVSHDSKFLENLHNLPPSTVSNDDSVPFLKEEVVQLIKAFETIETFSTWEEALAKLYELLHSINIPQKNDSSEKDIVREVIKNINKILRKRAGSMRMHTHQHCFPYGQSVRQHKQSRTFFIIMNSHVCVFI